MESGMSVSIEWLGVAAITLSVLASPRPVTARQSTFTRWSYIPGHYHHRQANTRRIGAPEAPPQPPCQLEKQATAHRRKHRSKYGSHVLTAAPSANQSAAGVARIGR